MIRILLITLISLFISSYSGNAQDRMSHPVSTAHIMGVDGRAELVFDEPITEAFTVNVLDLTGKVMFTQQHLITGESCSNVELPVENLRKGIYMVQVMSAGGKTKTLKLQRN